MIQVCIFVPFLHDETPKPINVVKSLPHKEFEIPQATLTAQVLDYRMKIALAQKQKDLNRIKKQF